MRLQSVCAGDDAKGETIEEWPIGVALGDIPQSFRALEKVQWIIARLQG